MEVFLTVVEEGLAESERTRTPVVMIRQIPTTSAGYVAPECA